MAQLKNGKEYLEHCFTDKRPVYNKGSIDQSTYPESQVRGRIAKSYNWQVCKSWIDEENKRFVYDVMVSAHESEIRTVSFSDACALLHWSKLEVVDNGQKIKWHADENWLEAIPKMMERGKKNAVKVLKEAEKEKKMKETSVK